MHEVYSGDGGCSFRIVDSDGEFFRIEAKLDRFDSRDIYYLSSDFNASGTGSLKFRKGRCAFTVRWGTYSFVVRRNQYEMYAHGRLELKPYGGMYHNKEKRSFLDFYRRRYSVRIRIPGRPDSAWIAVGNKRVEMRNILSCEGYTYFEAFLPARMAGSRYFFLSGAMRLPSSGCYVLPAIRQVRLSWVSGAIFYQIFPDRYCRAGNAKQYLSSWNARVPSRIFFGGNLEGIRRKLGHISGLGVNCLYLNPVFAAGTEHRYDTWDYFVVDRLLGNSSDLIRLAQSGHRKGIRIILDAVFNHTGLGFRQFHDFLKGRNRWFIPHCPFPIRIYFGRYSGSGTPPCYETWEGVGMMPKLNYDNARVRGYLSSVLKYWEKIADIDGWRFDVGESLPLDFLLSLQKRTASSGKYMLGEIWKDPSFWLEECHYHGTMNYTFREIILSFLGNKISAGDFCKSLNSFYIRQPFSGTLCEYNLLGSHDTDRVATVLKTAERVRAAYALLYSLPGSPAIYYGDEFMLRGSGGEGARGTIDWDKKCLLCGFFSRLAHLRMERPELRYGGLHAVADGNSVCISRSYGKRETCFIINMGKRKHFITKGKLLFSSGCIRGQGFIQIAHGGWAFIS